MIEEGDFVTLKPEHGPRLRGGHPYKGGYGRLRFGEVYEVLKITSHGHLMLQTLSGKMFYSNKLFEKVDRPLE
jgi:hypothetical protein